MLSDDARPAHRRSGAPVTDRLLQAPTAGRATCRRRSPVRSLDRGHGGAAGRPRRGREAPGGFAPLIMGCTGEPAVGRREPDRRRSSGPALLSGEAPVGAVAGRDRRLGTDGADTPRARTAIRPSSKRRSGRPAPRHRRLRCSPPTRRSSPNRAWPPAAARRRRAPTRKGFDPAATQPRAAPARPSRRRSCSASATRSAGSFSRRCGQLSFWKMKDGHARSARTAATELLARLQIAAPRARFHPWATASVQIVASATVAGPAGQPDLAAGRRSLFLVQGALSPLGLPPRHPARDGTAGYFHAIVKTASCAGRS